MVSDPTPAEEMPAVGGAHAHDRPASVPALDPEDGSGRARGYFGGADLADQAQDDTEVDAQSGREFEQAEDSATDVQDDTDRPVSDRLDETGVPTRSNVRQDATELEPESPEELTATESSTDSGSGASLYPGQLNSVRAPGWDQSGAIDVSGVDSRRSVERPGRHESAPMLEPASVPSLRSFHDEPPQDDELAMSPVEDVQSNTRIRRQLTAVDQAAKELARAALQAEIEKEDKRALQHYEPEEGEIPPSPDVAKRFDVILQLGKGGMAVVYLCRDPRRKGKVLAVKDIRAEMKPGMRVEQRVEHEAMLLKELDHPGIVKVYEFLKFQRGSAIVMEFIDGLPLDHEIGAGRKITWDFGVRILREIGSALEYAHKNGVIHRDIKPDNILYSERHSIMKLVDFGLARMFGDQTEVHMTRTGMVVGTPHYMSPEQVGGKTLDQRSDVYSFGATLYYLLTGQRHVEGSNVMDILEQQRSKDILPPSHLRRDIPGWLSYVVGKMMEVKPDDRYQDMGEVLKDVDLAEEDPEFFVVNNPRGPVKRFAGAELTPPGGETDGVGVAPEPGDAWPSSQAPSQRESSTGRPTLGEARTTRKRIRSSESSSSQQLALPDIEGSPAQLSAMLREVSVRLEQAEKRQVGPGLLVLIVLLSVLIVMLLITGGLLLAAREGYLARLLSL